MLPTSRYKLDKLDDFGANLRRLILHLLLNLTDDHGVKLNYDGYYDAGDDGERGTQWLHKTFWGEFKGRECLLEMGNWRLSCASLANSTLI